MVSPVPTLSILIWSLEASAPSVGAVSVVFLGDSVAPREAASIHATPIKFNRSRRARQPDFFISWQRHYFPQASSSCLVSLSMFSGHLSLPIASLASRSASHFAPTASTAFFLAASAFFLRGLLAS